MQLINALCTAALLATSYAQNSTGPRVDLGYAIYEGTQNTALGHNIFRGIRFAAPPIGPLRWQEPQAPAVNRSAVQMATAVPYQCPQTSYNGGAPIPVYGPNPNNEDCLFLNVYAPANASNLPALIWFHGGGYGLGNASQWNYSNIITANNNGFVVVSLQYRLGAFGFLASDEVARFGTANAGIHDLRFGLEWVQKYIHLFGGDPTKVTITGESAGAGAVMLMNLAYGGTLKNSLFRYSIAASPYLPMQYGYKDFVPSQSYYAFAIAAGCPPTQAYGNSSTSILECLRNADTQVLQNASNTVSRSGRFDTWAFLPVTDGKMILQRPSQQLLEKKVNGERVLVGNNAEEGAKYTPQNIKTETDLIAWLRITFPSFQDSDIQKVLKYYPSAAGNASVNSSTVLFATDGINPPYANDMSDIASGQQSRANNIYAETTFICSSYWMAEAFSNANYGRQAYRYQYSVGPALHATDVSGYFGPPTANQGADFSRAFMQIWGQFTINGDPSIPASVANGANATNAMAANPATNWPVYTVQNPMQVVLNTTGGQVVQAPTAFGVYNFTLTQRIGPGLKNNFTLVDAYTWEGGRGYRCDFWRNMGAIVPE